MARHGPYTRGEAISHYVLIGLTTVLLVRLVLRGTSWPWAIAAGLVWIGLMLLLRAAAKRWHERRSVRRPPRQEPPRPFDGWPPSS